MTDLMDRVSSYDLFVNLFPGIIFAVISNKVTSYSFLQSDIIIGFFVYYFIGVIINGFGSLLIEPALKWVKFLKFENYEDYICACKEDQKIELLSEKNNMYLTLSSLLALLIILKIYESIENYCHALKEYRTVLLALFLMIMFLFSYRKQTNYIKKRIKNAKR
jgi:hypothetical protein